MAESESIRDPRVDREDSGPRVVVAGDREEGVPPREGVLNAFEELHRELAKTAVLSDSFKDYILGLALSMVEEATAGAGPGSAGVEQEALREEFLSRRFDDKSRVKLNAASSSSERRDK